MTCRRDLPHGHSRQHYARCRSTLACELIRDTRNDEGSEGKADQRLLQRKLDLVVAAANTPYEAEEYCG